MSARLRPVLLAVVVLVALVAAITFRGYGPLAAHDAPTSTTTPATAPQTDATSPSAAGNVTAVSGAPDATTPKTKAKVTTTGMAPTANSPLAGAVSGANLPAFERTNVKLTNLEHTVNVPITPMVAQARAACATLDHTVPLLDALRATCRDSIAVAKLTRALANRCASPSTACTRTSLRLATAADHLVTARRHYARAIRAELPAGACRATILPTHDELAGLRAVGDALQSVADASAAGDDAAFASAGQTLGHASRKAYSDGRPAEVIIDAFRTACHLQRYPDPVG